MSIRLLAIKFNHDPTSAHRDAINIRRNGDRFITVPEWQSDSPAVSAAAYSIEDTRDRTITIQAKFRSLDPRVRSVEVRAIDSSLPGLPDEWIDWLASLLVTAPSLYPYAAGYLASIWTGIWAGASGVLGHVAARTIDFDDNGETGFEVFELPAHRLEGRGVGVYDVEWTWQVRASAVDLWTDFATTRHRIYALIGVPTTPWLQAPYDSQNSQLPWTDVLDVACNWAESCRTREIAAARITEEVYSLGPRLLEYDCSVGGIPGYALIAFNCTHLLFHLRTGRGNRLVNCTDCATIVSSFSNIVGCDLWQSRCFTPGQPFPVNPILAIGARNWALPCGVGFFSYHEIAWTDGCTERDSVFDACLQVDESPPLPPFNGLLPANMRFGKPGDRQYRDLLATQFGRVLCEPQPDSRERKFIV
jgi:hypothetical protein